MLFSEVKHDRPGFKQRKIAVLIGRDLPERMDLAMRGFFQLLEGQQPDVIGLPDFLKRPTHAHVAGLPLALVGRILERGDGRFHGFVSCF